MKPDTEIMSSSSRALILGIGGAPFADSSSERALKISLAAAVADGAQTRLIAGPDLVLPLYDPRTKSRDDKQRALVESLRGCDGLIISSPSYHGSVSGLVKNALDYIEDLRGDARVYLDGLAVGLIVCAGGWQGAGQTLSAMRSIVHAVRGWPTPLGALINTSDCHFDQRGQCSDAVTNAQLVAVGTQVAQHSRLQLQSNQQHARAPSRVALLLQEAKSDTLRSERHPCSIE